MPGTLYIVATPIGNLADITLRALSVLREVDLIAAEDTRVTHNLLRHYDIDTTTTPFHRHSLARPAERLIDELRAGKNIAIVSDAGTPGISDPGHEIITLAIDAGIPVVAIPGPNAVVTALVASGLPTARFAFEGFPPRRPSDRRSAFRTLAGEPRTLVFYESPHRLQASLADMRAAWGDRRIAVVREATKIFEEVVRGTIGEAVEHFELNPPRGEFTIVVEGAEPVEEKPSGERVKETLADLLDSGLSERDAVKAVIAEQGLPKNEAYRFMLELKEERSGEA